MHIKQFIEDAIEGGYEKDIFDNPKLWNKEDKINAYNSASTLLDPLAWQAVGKTRAGVVEGWEIPYEKELWREKWRQFFNHLADGATIEEVLLEISK